MSRRDRLQAVFCNTSFALEGRFTVCLLRTSWRASGAALWVSPQARRAPRRRAVLLCGSWRASDAALWVSPQARRAPRRRAVLLCGVGVLEDAEMSCLYSMALSLRFVEHLSQPSTPKFLEPPFLVQRHPIPRLLSPLAFPSAF